VGLGIAVWPFLGHNPWKEKITKKRERWRIRRSDCSSGNGAEEEGGEELTRSLERTRGLAEELHGPRDQLVAVTRSRRQLPRPKEDPPGTSLSRKKPHVTKQEKNNWGEGGPQP